MNLENYIDLSRRTDLDIERYKAAGERAKGSIRLLHGVMGLVTESGELADALKKEIFYARERDRQNLFEEIGDVFWYLALILRHTKEIYGVGYPDICAANISKLKARYPDSFDERHAEIRNIEEEMKSLMGKINETSLEIDETLIDKQKFNSRVNVELNINSISNIRFSRIAEAVTRISSLPEIDTSIFLDDGTCNTCGHASHNSGWCSDNDCRCKTQAKNRFTIVASFKTNEDIEQIMLWRIKAMKLITVMLLEEGTV